MARVVGDIAVTVGADITPLQGDMKRGGDAVKDFGNKAKRMGDDVSRAGLKADGSLSKMANGVQRSNRAMASGAISSKNFGRNVQNASFQVGDFAVQIASGTGAMRAMSQQLPQLLGGFGVMGAVAGAAAAILGAVVLAMQEGAGKGKTLTQAIEGINESLTTTKDLVALNAEGFSRLSDEFGEVTVGLLKLFEAQQSIGLRQLADEATALSDSLSAMYNGNAWLNVSRAEDMQNAFGLASQATRELAADLDAVGDAGSLDEQIRAVQHLRQHFVAAAGDVKDMTKAQFEFFVSITQTEAALLKVRNRTAEIEGEAKNLLAAIAALPGAAQNAAGALGSLEGPLRRAADAAWSIAQGVAAAASAQGRIAQENAGRSGRGGDPRQFGYGAADNALITSFGGINIPSYGGSSSGGGGGGGGGGGSGRNLSDEFEALRQKFATENEIVQEEYQKQLEQLEEFRAAKVATEQEFNELEARIQSEHNDKMRSLEQDKRAAMLDGMAGMFGDLSSLMRSENDKLFKIGKAAAIAEATVAGYKAAVDAWEKGMKIGGPPVAAAFTAASLAKTGALIANISSQSSSGGGGSASSAAAATAPPVADRGTYLNLSLVGEGPIGQDSVRDLIGKINDAVEDGAVLRGITVS